jgi:hypothetical protein
MPARPPYGTVTGHGQVHEDCILHGRPLQARSRLAPRNVPIPPALVRLIREHTERPGISQGGPPR